MLKSQLVQTVVQITAETQSLYSNNVATFGMMLTTRSLEPPTSQSTAEKISRLLIDQLNHLSNDDWDVKNQYGVSWILVSYSNVSEETGLFPDASLLDIGESEQQKEVAGAVEKMVQKALRGGFSKENMAALEKIFAKHKKIFCTSFSSVLPAQNLDFQNWLGCRCSPETRETSCFL